ncbi:MAG TPA: pyrroline-5-carboxylate reductase [Brumimicrobium sp.]|nr:pyrroline-5-carboxylate reductase [Brumimicrobium sp.]
MENKKIAIIGCGNLGLSILNGLLEKKTTDPSNITVTKRNIKPLEYLKETGVIISNDNVKAIQDSEVIIIALKPYNVLEVLEELNGCFISDKHILISLATGISLSQIQTIVTAPIPIFRAMPNTAADVGMSTTCISTNSKDLVATDVVQHYFNAFGETIIIDEGLMDSATVLGACGIAYVLRFIRAMIQGGIQIGFDAKTASDIVTNTVKGAAELLIKRGQHPEYEIDKVTTPKGCTIAGLNEMEHNGFSSALIKGILTSYDEIEK